MTIYFNNTFLDLPTDTKLSVQFTNPLFEDQPSWSLPLQLPRTAHNTNAFQLDEVQTVMDAQNTERVASVLDIDGAALLTEGDCYITIDGWQMAGTLRLLSVSAAGYEVNFTKDNGIYRNDKQKAQKLRDIITDSWSKTDLIGDTLADPDDLRSPQNSLFAQWGWSGQDAQQPLQAWAGADNPFTYYSVEEIAEAYEHGLFNLSDLVYLSRFCENKPFRLMTLTNGYDSAAKSYNYAVNVLWDDHDRNPKYHFYYTQEQTTDAAVGVSIQLKLLYVLDLVAKQLGFAGVEIDDSQNQQEQQIKSYLQNCVLINNCIDLLKPQKIYLSACMPNVTVDEFLQTVCSHFRLCMIPKDGVLHFVPLLQNTFRSKDFEGIVQNNSIQLAFADSDESETESDEKRFTGIHSTTITGQIRQHGTIIEYPEQDGKIYELEQGFENVTTVFMVDGENKSLTNDAGLCLNYATYMFADSYLRAITKIYNSQIQTETTYTAQAMMTTAQMQDADLKQVYNIGGRRVLIEKLEAALQDKFTMQEVTIIGRVLK